MNLREEDRILLFKFFCNQRDWIRNNDLTNFENLEELEKRFLNFMSQENCTDNDACMLFYFTIQNEIEKAKMMQNLINHHTRKTNKWGVTLKYKPITKPETNNKIILLWINASSTIPIDLFYNHVNAIGSAIEQKCKRNLIETQHTREDFK